MDVFRGFEAWTGWSNQRLVKSTVLVLAIVNWWRWVTCSSFGDGD